MSDHIKALFEGQDLSEEFKTKATAIFEAAVETEVEQKVAALKESLEAESQTATAAKIAELEESTQEYVDTEILSQVDKFLTVALKEWTEENESIMVSEAKVKLAEDLIASMSTVLESQGLVVPEAQKTVVEGLEEKVAKAEAKANELYQEKLALEEQILETKKSEIVKTIVSDLSESQRETFDAVVSKVAFVTEDQYRSSVKELFESYFPTKKPVVEDKEVVVEENDEDKESIVEENEFANSFYSSLSKALKG